MGRYVLRAHRVSFWLATGLEPAVVMHGCDNPPCVRPSHLYEGSIRLNNVDRQQKGRTAHGETHYAAKLTDQQVADIRRRYGFRGRGGEPAVALAGEYGVSKATISMIVRGRRRATAVV